MANPLMFETIWFDRYKYEDAFYSEQERLAQTTMQCAVETSSLVGEIAKARQQIKETLSSGDADKGTSLSNLSADAVSRIEDLEKKYENLHKIVSNLERRIASLEEKPHTTVTPVAPPKITEAPEPEKEKDDKVGNDDEEEEDIDLFGSDEEEETEEQIRQREERVRAYEAKKAKKPGVVAKSNIILFVKPWDDETDMKEMERLVRSLQTDGLLWGASKLVPVGYGINKLQISCVVEDDKVGTDWLEENITQFEDYVQSVDIAAFNKI